MDEKIEADSPVLTGELGELGPLIVRPVRDDEEDGLWKRFVRLFHYLGFGKLFGHQIKYFAFLGHTPVAALSFSAPSLKLAPRDAWIGWTPEERKAHLSRIVSNSRFLIFPGVKVKNLASAVLGKALARISGDWEERFGIRPWIVETFVDPARFSGTSYKAAGFLCLGSTAGFAKTKTGYDYHGRSKEIYVQVLDHSFRSVVGLARRDEPLAPERPDLSGWTPDAEPLSDGKDLTPEDVSRIAEEMCRFHETFSGVFRDRRVRALGIVYLAGLCSNLVRKSVEPIALAMKVDVRSLQRLMTGREWDENALHHLYREQLASEIASRTPEEAELSMITTDDSSFVKKGTESVGVARQYCGRLGKVENCQTGVFVGYAGTRGYALLDARLYMPKEWFSETEEFEKRRKKTGVPKDLAFKTKPQIAAEMIGALHKEGRFPARWIGCDAAYGANREFLDALPPDLWYFAAIRSNTRVLRNPPAWEVPPRKSAKGAAPTKPRLTENPQTVAEIAKTASFTPLILKDGSKGPLGAMICVLRVYPLPDSEGGSSRAEGLILLKTPDGEMKFAFSNAPETTSLETFGTISTLRWSIEQCFLENKSYLGMSHYEHRSWRAWHRHMLYVFLAHLFIVTVRRKLGEKKRAYLFPGPTTHRRRAPRPGPRPGRRNQPRDLPHPPKRDRRPLPQEKNLRLPQGTRVLARYRLNCPFVPPPPTLVLP